MVLGKEIPLLDLIQMNYCHGITVQVDPFSFLESGVFSELKRGLGNKLDEFLVSNIQFRLSWALGEV